MPGPASPSRRGAGPGFPSTAGGPSTASRWAHYLGSVLPMLRASEDPRRLLAFMLGLRRAAFTWEMRSGLRFRVRSPLDAWVVKETVLDRCYEAAGTPVLDGWRILDVGAGVGDFAVLAALANPSGRVVAFEPAEDAFALLEENLRLNGVGNVVPRREAIGAPGEQLGMETGTLTVRSRAVPVVAGGAAVRPVPTISLEEALDGLDVDSCDLVKMDVEGAEEKILLGARPRTLRRVRNFVVEVHEGTRPGLGSSLGALFTRLGYETRWTPDPAWPDLGLLHAGRRARSASRRPREAVPRG